MFSVGRALLSVLAAAGAFSALKVLEFVWYRPMYKSPLRHLRGPKRKNLFTGHSVDIMHDEDSTLVQAWVKEYGDTMRIKSFFNASQLLTVDTCAIHHILTHTDIYQKSPTIRFILKYIIGDGILNVEGAQHRQQRRVMNPAFGPTQLRALTEIFLEKGIRLRESWSSEIAKDSAATTSGTRIDVAHWLNKATLDIIGLAGFNYDFDALGNTLRSGGNSNSLGEAYSVLAAAAEGVTPSDVFRALFPPLRFIPNARVRKMEAAQRTMGHVGQGLLEDARAAALANASEDGKVEKSNVRGRDLLSLLVKANLATDIPESQKMSDKDVISQVPTFLVAGHETTSVATAWTLFALTQAPEIQTKLRDELLSVETDTPSMDELQALPYLDAVVRETLRMYPPIRSTVRLAMKDDVLPVKTPYIDRYGNIRDTIQISKDDTLTIQIQAINRSPALWGPDAHEYKPERWIDSPEAASQVPGIWSHLMTFLGGPRACIGFRFATLEIKAILFSVVRAFEFELAVPASQVGSKIYLAQRPILRGGTEDPNQLPLLVIPYQGN